MESPSPELPPGKLSGRSRRPRVASDPVDLVDLARRTRLLAQAMDPAEKKRMLAVADEIEALSRKPGRKAR